MMPNVLKQYLDFYNTNIAPNEWHHSGPGFNPTPDNNRGVAWAEHMAMQGPAESPSFFGGDRGGMGDGMRGERAAFVPAERFQGEMPAAPNYAASLRPQIENRLAMMLGRR